VTAALPAAAHAHTLGADEQLPLRLGHQLLGLHHLPLTLLLLIAGIVLIREYRKRGRTR